MLANHLQFSRSRVWPIASYVTHCVSQCVVYMTYTSHTLTLTLNFAGTPFRCGRSCTEAHGRCFQNRECGALLTSIPAKCRNIAVWNGEGDLPACNSDCREALNMFSKLPNAMEVECCDCGEDVSCAMFQAKIAAACPSRMNCRRVCMHAEGEVCMCVCGENMHI